MKKNVLLPLVALIGGFSVCSCNSCGKRKPTNPQVLQAYLEEHKKDVPCYDSYSVYVDLTDCMRLACEDSNTKRKLEVLVGKTQSSGLHCNGYYELKNDTITSLGKPNKATFNHLLNGSNCLWTAPIEKTLSQIIATEESAILITDFEEYQTGQIFRGDCGASTAFVSWLKKGNNITFFVFDFTETNCKKHLYLTVFDTPKRELLKEVENALGQGEKNYEVFYLNNSIYSNKTEYDWRAYGGNYRNKKGEDNISFTKEGGECDCYCFFEGLNAEYYPFGESWEYIVKNIADDHSLTKDDRNGDPPYTNLISGLSLDFTSMSGYAIKSLGLKMYAVQADYDAFFDSWTNDNTSYKPVKCGEIYDMFVFTGKVVKNKAKVSIDLKPGFSGKVANMMENDMVRVDVIIDSCVVVDGSHLKNLFSWQDKKGMNNSLHDAVLNTLQNVDILPQGRVVYSYFVQSI